MQTTRAKARRRQASPGEELRRTFLEQWRHDTRIDDPEAPPPMGFERCPRTRRLVAVGVRINGVWRRSVADELQE